MQDTRVWSPCQEDPLEKEPTPVFLPGKSRGQGSLGGYSPWGRTESDTTEWLTLQLLTFGKIKLREHFVTTLKSNIIHYFFFFLRECFSFWLCLMACGILILVPQSEFELAPPALEARNLNHRTAREVAVIYNICTKFTPPRPWTKFYCNMAMPIQLHIVCDCFCVITRAEKL